MDFDQLIQDSGSFILIKSQDIPKLAEIIATYGKSDQHGSVVKDHKTPIPQSEVMRRFNKTRQTIVRWRKKGILKGFLIGGRIYFHLEDIEALQQMNH